MAETLSPGVFIEEINASTIVPTVSNSIGIFSGNFLRGPVGTYRLITSVSELLEFYDYPKNANYNDWYQAYNFLQYGNKLLVSRAANVNGTATEVAGVVVSGNEALAQTVIEVGSTNGLAVGNLICFEDNTTGGANLDNVYEIVDLVANTSITLDRGLVETINQTGGFDNVYTVSQTTNGVFEATSEVNIATDSTKVVSGDEAIGQTVIEMASTTGLNIGDYVCFENNVSGGANTDNVYQIVDLAVDVSITLNAGLVAAINQTGGFDNVYTVSLGEATFYDYEYLKNKIIIENASDFETKKDSVAFNDTTGGKLKILARNPGEWSSNIQIAIATPSAFNQTVPSYAFDGIALDDLFEYPPTGTEVGFIIKSGTEIVETWTVDFDSTAKDFNNKSLYIEDVLNSQSNYVFVKENVANTNSIKDYLFTIGGASASTSGTVISLVYGADSAIGNDDLADGYDLFSNKEEVDIDIVIANELDYGISAKNLVDARKDCIGFIGAPYGSSVGQKSATAVSNLIAWRKGTGTYLSNNVNYNNMFVVGCGNYKYQYDRYNDKYRWVNIAGDIAGLRAQTSTNRASWWASAGLERGQIKNVTKLAFNPTQGQRDLLYKNSINPIVSFPGQGTVMWGQKTLLDQPSSFDRVNVRGLFNTLERALGKMAKFQIMEFNDNFTRNRIISMIKPYLSSVQAGRGIQDFLVICDESNNTPDIISRNKLIVDIYIKPTFVAEFIQLRFTNAGTNSFAEVIGG